MKRSTRPLDTVAKPPAVVIAGGGTGGHVFPGIALAEALKRRHPAARILFIGTDRPLETGALNRAGLAHRALAVEGLKRRGWRRQIRAVVKLPLGLVRAAALIAGHRPDVVVGVGGYAAGPVVLAAWLMGVSVVLCEQNIVAGATNRIAARFARRIYVSFPGTFFGPAAGKVRLTGNPVRAAIAAAARRRCDGRDGRLNVLVLGGSQGARAINAALVAALGRLAGLDGYRFVHQTGSDDHRSVAAAYRRHGAEAIVAPFFADMAAHYARADLVICRAGATTVAELAAVGVPAVFIPFPFAADDHQARNVAALLEGGAAERIDEENLTGAVLAERLADLAAHRERLAEMARRMTGFGRPDAAERIWDDIFALLDREKGLIFNPPSRRTTDNGQRTNG